MNPNDSSVFLNNLSIELIVRFTLRSHDYFSAAALCLTCTEYSGFLLRQDLFREGFINIWGPDMIVPSNETNWIVEYRERPFLVSARVETRGPTARALSHWSQGNGEPYGVVYKLSSMVSRENVSMEFLKEYFTTLNALVDIAVFDLDDADDSSDDADDLQDVAVLEKTNRTMFIKRMFVKYFDEYENNERRINEELEHYPITDIGRFQSLSLNEAFSLISSFPTIKCAYGKGPQPEDQREDSIRTSLSYLMSTKASEVKDFPLPIDVLQEKMKEFEWFTYDPRTLPPYDGGKYFHNSDCRGCAAYLGCLNTSLGQYSFISANGNT